MLGKQPKDASKVQKARDAVRAAAGEDAAADAVATAAFFAFMTRVVDASGHTNPMMSYVNSKRAPSAATVLLLTAGVVTAALCWRWAATRPG